MTQWLVLHVHSGREMDVKWAIDETFKRIKPLEGLVWETLAPVRQVAVHATKNIISEPVIKGYVFVRCHMTGQLWHYLRKIPYVYRILSGPVSDEEIGCLRPHLERQAELRLPEQDVLSRIRVKFREVIEAKRNKKKVLRLPLTIFRDLLKYARLLFAGPITERKVFRLMLDSP
jgi:transcription antitermination factor NusG